MLRKLIEELVDLQNSESFADGLTAHVVSFILKIVFVLICPIIFIGLPIVLVGHLFELKGGEDVMVGIVIVMASGGWIWVYWERVETRRQQLFKDKDSR